MRGLTLFERPSRQPKRDASDPLRCNGFENAPWWIRTIDRLLRRQLPSSVVPMDSNVSLSWALSSTEHRFEFRGLPCKKAKFLSGTKINVRWAERLQSALTMQRGWVLWWSDPWTCSNWFAAKLFAKSEFKLPKRFLSAIEESITRERANLISF